MESDLKSQSDMAPLGGRPDDTPPGTTSASALVAALSATMLGGGRTHRQPAAVAPPSRPASPPQASAPGFALGNRPAGSLALEPDTDPTSFALPRPRRSAPVTSDGRPSYERHIATVGDLVPHVAGCRECRATTDSVELAPDLARSSDSRMHSPSLASLPEEYRAILSPDPKTGARGVVCPYCKLAREMARATLGWANLKSGYLADSPTLRLLAHHPRNHAHADLEPDGPALFRLGNVFITAEAFASQRTRIARVHGQDIFTAEDDVLTRIRRFLSVHATNADEAGAEEQALGILAPRAARNARAVRRQRGDVHTTYIASTILIRTAFGPKPEANLTLVSVKAS